MPRGSMYALFTYIYFWKNHLYKCSKDTMHQSDEMEGMFSRIVGVTLFQCVICWFSVYFFWFISWSTYSLEVQPPCLKGWFPSFTIILVGVYHHPKGVSPFLKWWLTSRVFSRVTKIIVFHKKGPQTLRLREEFSNQFSSAHFWHMEKTDRAWGGAVLPTVVENHHWKPRCPFVVRFVLQIIIWANYYNS